MHLIKTHNLCFSIFFKSNKHLRNSENILARIFKRIVQRHGIINTCCQLCVFKHIGKNPFNFRVPGGGCCCCDRYCYCCYFKRKH